MRAGGVCDVNSLTGLIPPACPNDQTLANLEDSQVASWECGGYWCTGKWDTVGTHRYSREGQMRGCFMVWAVDHVRREKGLTAHQHIMNLASLQRNVFSMLQLSVFKTIRMKVLKVFVHLWNDVTRKQLLVRLTKKCFVLFFKLYKLREF